MPREPTGDDGDEILDELDVGEVSGLQVEPIGLEGSVQRREKRANRGPTPFDVVADRRVPFHGPIEFLPNDRSDLPLADYGRFRARCT
jgi:hypothetical protein